MDGMLILWAWILGAVITIVFMAIWFAIPTMTRRINWISLPSYIAMMFLAVVIFMVIWVIFWPVTLPTLIFLIGKLRSREKRNDDTE